MIDRFIATVTEQHLFPQGKEVLLAVSGGVDSTVLCDLAYHAGVRFAIAHCNFHLRPGDCDCDEAFVRQLAERYGARCFVAEFDTVAFAETHHLSIEDAARQLRYAYFGEVCQSESISVVATAHHRDDAVETFFINLLRGTGIGGLHGIRAQSLLSVGGSVVESVHLVRPLLAFSRSEIESYATENGLCHVEDSSNASLAYRRNQIRHRLMPLLRELSPNVDEVMQQNIARLADVGQVYADAVAQCRQKVVHSDGDLISLSISDVEQLSPRRTLLFELLRPYGFGVQVVDDLLRDLYGRSGRRFFSKTHRLIVDRERLLVCPIETFKEEVPLHYEVVECEVELRQPRWRACFDADKVRYPLHQRHWRDGDRFHPFGMRGTKLISDFFCDEKMTLVEKESQQLLCDDDDQILWVIGRRASQVASVTPQTSRVLLVSVDNR